LLAVIGIGQCCIPGIPALATPLTPGNIVVMSENDGSQNPPLLIEFTPQGAVVQSYAFPQFTSFDEGRDLTVDKYLRPHIYNGTFSPRLTVFEPITETFPVNATFSGWSTVNNTRYGGMAAYDRYVYATDMATAGSGSPRGVVRFNVDDFSAVRLSDAGNTTDLNIGLDYLLYTTGGGSTLRVYDPVSLEFVRTVSLPRSHDGIAVDENGHIYASGGYHYDANGNELAHVSIPGGDIDVSRDGRVLFSARSGVLTITDKDLNVLSSFNTPRSRDDLTWGAFVQMPVPEPSAVCLAVLGLLALPMLGRRQLRR